MKVRHVIGVQVAHSQGGSAELIFGVTRAFLERSDQVLVVQVL